MCVCVFFAFFFIQKHNQFVGYVIPNILDSIHQISNNYLSGNLSKFLEGEEAEDKRSHYFRQTIFDSIRSIVASNSGNQVSPSSSYCLN